eukprot:9407128-Alexandrium_andersonii.AAC.1
MHCVGTQTAPLALALAAPAPANSCRPMELPLGRPDNSPPTERSPRPESRSKPCSSAARWPQAADAL